MQVRLNYGKAAPGVYEAMDALDQYIAQSGLDEPARPGLCQRSPHGLLHLRVPTMKHTSLLTFAAFLSARTAGRNAP